MEDLALIVGPGAGKIPLSLRERAGVRGKKVFEYSWYVRLP